MATRKIPRATAKRLPVYYRYLNVLLNANKRRVSSTELSEAVKVDSATIRRDFPILANWASAAMAMMWKSF